MNGNPEEYKPQVQGVDQQYEEQEGLRPIGYYIGLIIGGQAEENKQEAKGGGDAMQTR